eukprot:CAMPEP_0196719808 /NCGR_PEP_ID=MMETSP1091-20130531/2739_1 /TAXON_ID=302021 /ORGANISM="Rhodomonas sp., Strain CCMP768" /LENGTH=73 /DNA_ID=CAMNT_0042060871 /DNA_START=75 /DNA_END=296 /DNA_ORIENTATION=+
MFDKIMSSAKPETQSLYEEKKPQATEMLASSWLNGGYKVKSFARNAPYAQGSIIPGSNYSAQDNHDSLKVSGL